MNIQGSVTLPGDKSISHRILVLQLLGAVSASIHGLNPGRDVACTRAACRQLSAAGMSSRDALTFNCGNAATTARLLMGALAHRPGECRFVGDASLSARDMSTLITILQEWGVHFKFEGTPYHLPLRMYGTSALQIPPACISVSSAQVASALQLAALRASGTLSLDVRAGLRDHTEILLRNASSDVPVPKDPSAAAVFAVAAASLPGSDLLLSDVCLNPTRLGFVRVMQRMGADIQTRCCSGDGQNTELRGEIAVRYSRGICATHITAAETPTLVDEIMMLALLATQAEGQTVFEDISPLRNKESDRAEAIFATLKRLGAAVSLSGSTLRVSGPVVLRGGQCLDSRGDHRLVMCHAIAALLTDTKTLDYTDADMVGVSYPDFFAGLDALTQSEDCYTGACLKEKKSEESF